MRRVLYSLAPIWALSVWLYGPRVVLLTVVSLTLGVLTEYLYEKRRNGKVSEAVLVTATLFALSLPPAAPLWIAAVGIVFAVFTAKMIYGGFGRNIYNPAIAGRLFVYISFATVLGKSFLPHGNFGLGAGTLLGRPEVLSAATPLAVWRSGGSVPLLGLLTGLRDGSVGESSVILIAAAAVYLIWTKTASWRIIVSEVAAGGILALALHFAGVKAALPPASLLAGSFLFVAVFMGTDPVSAPKKPASHWIYGTLIGITAIIIRTFSAFPEGTSFAVFVGNTFASMIDDFVVGRQNAKKARIEAAASAAGGTAPASPGSAAAAGTGKEAAE
ncbi:MAG: RnfABCDGE type electron transport complex subunit D [Treponema sp.]|nr:RnfABCDGE type electron transport complex subunit D [Treponema sp.]